MKTKRITALLLIFAMLLSFCPSVFADSKESKEEYGIWPVILFSKQKVVNLQVMVKDENVYAKASDLAGYYGYEYFENEADAIVYNKSQNHLVRFTSEDKKIIYRTVEKKSAITYEYTMPFEAKKNAKGFWVPLSYSLLLMDGDNVISSAYLATATPTALSEIEKVEKNADKYRFDIVNDLGDSKGRLKLCAICTYLNGLRKGNIAYITYDTFETKYVDKLAVSFCAKDSDTQREVLGYIKTTYDVLDQTNAISSLNDFTNNLQYNAAHSTLLQTTDRFLQQLGQDRKLSKGIRKVCAAYDSFQKKSTTAANNLTEKFETLWNYSKDNQLGIDADLVCFFLNFCINAYELSNCDTTSVNSMVDFCEYMDNNGTKYISNNAEKTVSLYVNNADNKKFLFGKSILSAYYEYMDSTLDKFETEIIEHNALTSETIKKGIFGVDTGVANLCGDIVLFLLARNGVTNAEKSTMIVYSQGLQDEAERWYRDSLRNLQADPNDPDKWRQYAESTYTFLRWCYITRSLGCEIIETYIKSFITPDSEEELLNKYKAQLEELNKEVCQAEAFYYLLSDKTDTSSASKNNKSLTINNRQAAVSGFGVGMVEPTVLFATNKGTSNTDVDPYFGMIPPVEASAKEGYKENDARIIEQIIFDTGETVGNVIEYNDAIYYWNRPEYTSLICLKDDKEKVVFDTVKLSKKDKKKYTGFREIAGAGNRLFFVVKDGSDNCKLCSVDLNGSDYKEYDVKSFNKPLGNIIGITPDKKFIQIGIVNTSFYYYHTIREFYYYLNIKTGEISLIKGSEDVLSSDDNWFYNGEIYYIKYKESKHTITLYKSALDGSDKIKLGVFKTPRYDADAGYLTVSQALYPVIDDNPYVYFSYGVIQGTGLFFGSSRVARARLDGSDYRVMDISNDNSTGSLFFVDEDGSISYLDRTLTYDELGIGYYWDDDGIYVMDSTTGRGVRALTSDEIYQNTKEFSKYSLSAESAEIVGNKAFVLLQSTSEGETMHDIIINGTVFLEKDLKSGKVKRISKS